MQLAFGPETGYEEINGKIVKILYEGDDIFTFANFLKNDTKIHTLDIDSHFSKEQSDAIAEALTKNKHLKELALRPHGQEFNTQQNVELIINALKENEHLEKLEICNHNFTQVENLHEKFESLGKLNKLKFWYCNLGNAGAKAIANNLKNNVNLKSLTFTKSNVEDDGAIALANALKTNDCLSFFSLNNSTWRDDWRDTPQRISDNSVKQFAEALKENKSLKTLFLENSFHTPHLNDSCLEALLDALRVNTSLEHLLINCDLISPIYRQIELKLKFNSNEQTQRDDWKGIDWFLPENKDFYSQLFDQKKSLIPLIIKELLSPKKTSPFFTLPIEVRERIFAYYVNEPI